MTTFIPSLCILVIAQLTVYIKPEHFSTSLPVTATALVGKLLLATIYQLDEAYSVLYTLYSSATRSIPTTSYMKAVEWWLLFHCTGPFIIFIVIFLKEHKFQQVQYMRKEGDESTIQKILDTLIDYFLFFGKFLLPLVTFVFVIIFTVIVLIQY